QQTVDSTVSQSTQVQGALKSIFKAVGTIVDQNQQIATAAEQQTAVSQDIDQSIVQISVESERTASGADQAEQARRALSNLISRWREAVGAFRECGDI